jgi:hypothetical protein
MPRRKGAGAGAQPGTRNDDVDDGTIESEMDSSGCAVVPARFMPRGCSPLAVSMDREEGNQTQPVLDGKPADPAHAPRMPHMGEFAPKRNRNLCDAATSSARHL